MRVFICPDDIVNPSLIIPAGPDYAGLLWSNLSSKGDFNLPCGYCLACHTHDLSLTCCQFTTHSLDDRTPDTVISGDEVNLCRIMSTRGTMQLEWPLSAKIEVRLSAELLKVRNDHESSVSCIQVP